MIEIKLREMTVEGQRFLIPTNMNWQAWARRWVIRVGKNEEGIRPVYGFPASRYNGVLAAFVAGLDKLDELRRTEVLQSTLHIEHQTHKQAKALDVGLDLDTQHRKTVSLHYIRVSVGSLKAGTLRKKNFLLGVVGQYTEEHYLKVYAIAKECRNHMAKIHLEEIRQLKSDSHRATRQLIDEFLRKHHPELSKTLPEIEMI